MKKASGTDAFFILGLEISLTDHARYFLGPSQASKNIDMAGTIQWIVPEGCR